MLHQQPAQPQWPAGLRAKHCAVVHDHQPAAILCSSLRTVYLDSRTSFEHSIAVSEPGIQVLCATLVAFSSTGLGNYSFAQRMHYGKFEAAWLIRRKCIARS